MPDQMDEALIARAQGGDNAAIGALFERHRQRVFRYFYYRVGDQHIAEDLTVEVFLRLVRALPSYRPQGVPFQAWLFQVARHLAVDHFRKMNRRQDLELNESLAAKDEDLDHAAERRLTSDRLRAALARLTDEQRDVISLRFVSDMPIAEVAEALGKSESAVKALQRRGLEALRQILADWKVAYD